MQSLQAFQRLFADLLPNAQGSAELREHVIAFDFKSMPYSQWLFIEGFIGIIRTLVSNLGA